MRPLKYESFATSGDGYQVSRSFSIVRRTSQIRQSDAVFARPIERNAVTRDRIGANLRALWRKSTSPRFPAPN